jgi:hypothetical protein
MSNQSNIKRTLTEAEAAELQTLTAIDCFDRTPAQKARTAELLAIHNGSDVFTTTAKRVSAGKKIEYSLFRNGVEIGKRTTGRIYTVALLGYASREYSIQNANENIAYHNRTKGSDSLERIAYWTQRIADIRADKLPEFNKLQVISWHSNHSTARIPKWTERTFFVELAQPEFITPEAPAKRNLYEITSAVSGLEPFEPVTTTGKQSARAQCKEFCEAYAPVSRRRLSGERMEELENGWCVKHPAGGTVVISTFKAL